MMNKMNTVDKLNIVKKDKKWKVRQNQRDNDYVNIVEETIDSGKKKSAWHCGKSATTAIKRISLLTANVKRKDSTLHREQKNQFWKLKKIKQKLWRWIYQENGRMNRNPQNNEDNSKSSRIQ